MPQTFARMGFSLEGPSKYGSDFDLTLCLTKLSLTGYTICVASIH